MKNRLFTLLSPVLLIATTAIAQIIPAPDDQEEPSVATGTNGYFVVWADKRNYANDEYDIYGARVSKSGEVLDPNGIPICTNPGRQTSPRVAFNGTEFLVVWEDDRESTTNSVLYQIYGARVTADGQVLDTNGFKITTNQIARTGPAVASDGNSFFAVWVDWYRSSNSIAIFGSPISPDGVVANPDGISLVQGPSPHSDPRIAYANGQYLVTYLEGTQIRGLRTTTGGVPLSSPFAISSQTANDRHGLASNGRDFFELWGDYRNSPPGFGYPHIYGTLILSNGAVLYPGGIPISTNGYYAERPKVASDISGFVAVWQESNDPTNGITDIYGARLTANGQIGSPARMAVNQSPGVQMNPDIAGMGTNILAVWQDGRSAPNDPFPLGAFDIYGTLINGLALNTNGLLISSIQTTNHPPIANSQFITTTQDFSFFITLTATDPDNDPLTYRIVSPPSFGFLTGAPPHVLYYSTTNLLTTVTDSFMFAASDGIAESAPATITLLLFPQSTDTLPFVSLIATDSIASESLNPDGTTNTATFAIQRTGDPSNAVPVDLSVHGSAIYGTDYYTVPALLGLFSNSTTTVFMPAGSTSVVFTLYPIPDNIAEGSEFAIFTINTNSNYVLGSPSQITVTVLDSNAPPVPGTRVFFPPNGANYASPLDIKVRVSKTNLTSVKLYADEQLLASYTSAPTLLAFVTNFSVGAHTIYSVGNDSVTSPPVHFQVLAPLTQTPLSPTPGIAPEANASFVLDSNGALFDFGDGRLGALADGYGPNLEPQSLTALPVQIPLPAGTNRFVKISSGTHHTLALTADGSLWTSGDNSSGQIGQGKSTATFTGFVTIPEFPGWKDIAAGNAHSLVLDKTGKLAVCGNNLYGQLGLGNTTNTSVFQIVPFPEGVTAWTAITAGSNYSIALADNGNLYACGMGLFGTLGNGGQTNSSRFVPVSLPTGVTNWLKVTAGAQHVLAIAGNGALYAWGLGSLGQLGNGSFSSSSVPRLVTPPAGVSNWLALAAGLSHSLGIGNDGNLYGWGNSALGQLGPGPIARPLPTLIPPPGGVSSWKTIAAGINHSLGLGDNCTLYAWGQNNFGQLGIGSTTNQTNEVTVSNLGDLCAPPTVTITYPTEGSVFPASANILINAEASSLGAQIARIDLFANSALLASGTNTPFSFVWSNVVQGSYILTAAVADNANPASFSTSAPVNITVVSSNTTLPFVFVQATDGGAAEPPPTNNGTFTFFRSDNLQGPLTVLFKVSGTAILNTDYQTSPPLASGTTNTIYFRTIPAGSNSATLTVIPLADSILEPPETVVVTLLTNSSYRIGGPGNATVSILNNTNTSPLPVLNLVTTDSQAYELTASGGIDTGSFAVTRTGTLNSFIRFPITVSGTATYGVDYYTDPPFQVSSNSSTTFFAMGTNQSSVVFIVYPIPDNLVEGTETATFTLGSNSSYTIGPSNQSLISIIDGPAPPPLAGIVFPPDRAVFASPESITIKGSATNALELRLYADNQLLGSTNSLGFQNFLLAIPTNFPPGLHTAYAVGTNRFGLIANTFTSAPIHFQVLAPLSHPISPSIGVAPQASASYVIDGNGALFDWGSDTFAQLGDGIDPGNLVTRVLVPEQLPLGDGTNRWSKVVGGQFHTLALDSAGRLYSAGEAGSGQLGRTNTLIRATLLPVPFPTNVTGWKDVAAGGFHSLGIATDGRLFAWGNNALGQLGIPGVPNLSVPRIVPFPAGVTAWNAVAAGTSLSVALANDGNIYTCGLGPFGELGTGGTTNSATFVLVSLPTGVTNWLGMICGSRHVLAIAGDHSLYAWGAGTSGQLGNGDFTNATVPTLVSSPVNVSNWLALAGGVNHSLGLAENGDLYSWGLNVFGQLGPGPVTSSVPTLVTPPGGVATWRTVGAGFGHSLAISDGCTLYAWGENNFGQLGIGSINNQTNEVPVQNLNTLCAAFTNQPPIAFSQFLVATQRTVVPITLTASDADNDPLTYQIVMPPSLGYLTGAPPNILYISTTNFLTTVTDRFSFVANDGHTDSFPATVTLLLVPPGGSSNTLPVVTIASTDSVASEFLNFDGTTNSANFTIRRTGSTNDPLSVLLNVAGTANYGVDYYTIPPLNVSSNAQMTVVPIPAGAASVPFTLYGTGHYLPNSSVFSIFAIGTNSGYSLGAPNQLTVLIINSNQPPVNVPRILFPPNGAVFASPQNIELRVASTNVQILKLYADNQLLATAAQYGTFVFSYITNFAPGPHIAYAVRDNSVTSAPVHFFVLATNALHPNSPSLGVMPTANSSFVIDGHGALFGWGDDRYGNLGDGGLTNTGSGVNVPIQIPLPEHPLYDPDPLRVQRWMKVSAGAQHTLLLGTSGGLYMTGGNGAGQTGIGTNALAVTGVVLDPTHLVLCKDIAAGGQHSLALTREGRLYAWGFNAFGQLGNGNITNAPFPQLIAFPSGVTNWTAIAAGNNHSLALDGAGNLYAWGSGVDGILGTGGTTNSSRPLKVVLPAGVSFWTKISAGSTHNLALGNDGKLYAWGAGFAGQLGIGYAADEYVPIPVLAPTNVLTWSEFAAGHEHSLGIADNGKLYLWGVPTAGASLPFVFLPTPVSNPDGVHFWSKASAGWGHSLALGDNCTLYSIGLNNFGQLGIGSFMQQTNLQTVKNLENLCAEILVTVTNHAPSFVKGPDITVPANSGIQVFTNWATQINPGAPSETNQILAFIVTNDNPHLFSTQPGIVPSGSLFFAGAPNSNGIAHVTVVLRDNGGTANGGQDTSTPQTFVITITPPNHAPVPAVRIFPSFLLSSNYSAFQVISPNGSNALVYFDASLSSDVDGDPLSFAWFAHGTNDLFGTSVVATNTLPVGDNSMTLAVNDSHVTVLQPFVVEVITPGSAVAELMGLIQNFGFRSTIQQGTWRQLIAPLQSAQSEFDSELWNAGLVHLRIFQSRVSDQIGGSNPALANTLIHTAQQIADAVQGNSKHQPSISSIQNRGGQHKSITFTGSPGQVYLVQASSDLSHWETIGIATESDAGSFQFDDSAGGNATARYYRLVLP